MNPRVKELAEEAGGVVLAGSEIEKFAELIVKQALPEHCSCYKLGYHPMVDFQQRSAEAIAQQKARTE